MKKHLQIFSLVLLLTPAAIQAQEIKKDLRPFSKVIVSPKINVILHQGSRESIRIDYFGIEPEKIQVEQDNDRLKIYLEEARFVEKQDRYDDSGSKVGRYHQAIITAHITYTHLDLLEVRGDQEITCLSPIEADQFTLRVYGENEITLDTLRIQRFKLVAYGENKIRLKGTADHQRYALYGENKVDSRALTGATISTNLYGEGRLMVKATDEVKINAIGEPRIEVEGTSFINKGIILGKSEIRPPQD